MGDWMFNLLILKRRQSLQDIQGIIDRILAHLREKEQGSLPYRNYWHPSRPAHCGVLVNRYRRPSIETARI